MGAAAVNRGVGKELGQVRCFLFGSKDTSDNYESCSLDTTSHGIEYLIFSNSIS